MSTIPKPKNSQEATAALHQHLLYPMDGDSMPDPQLVAELLDCGADINAPDAQGMVPLLRCLSWGYSTRDPDVFKQAAHATLDILLARGADLNTLTPDKKNHADLASLWKDDQLALKKLGRETYRRSRPELMADIKKIDPDWPKPGEPVSSSLQIRFLHCCMNVLIEEATYIAHLYPEAVNWQYNMNGHEDDTALMHALRHRGDAPDITRLFIQFNADLGLQNIRGETALHLAAIGDTSSIAQLIRAGADENKPDNNGRTPLDLATHTAGLANDAYLNAMQAAIAIRTQKQAMAAQQTLTRKNAATQKRIDTIHAQKKRSGDKFRL